MNTNPNHENETTSPVASLQVLLLGLLAIVLGTLLASIAIPKWLPALSASVLGESPKFYWYLARATAMVGFILLWLSMVFGTIITNRVARLWPGGPVAYDLHQYFSLLGLGFALFHALILTGDRFIKANALQVMVPFSYQNYMPLWVGLGQLAFYAWAILVGSFYIRKRIGNKAWRTIHLLSYLTFALVMVHGIVSGTDSHTAWASIMYWSTGGSLLVLLFYRILISASSKQSPRARPAAQPAPLAGNLAEQPVRVRRQ